MAIPAFEVPLNRAPIVLLILLGLSTPAAAQSLGQWGGFGTGPGQFNAAYGIAVDPQGFVYVLDTGNARVQKFSASGVFLTMWGSPGDQDGQFNSAVGIAADAFGDVFVADTGNNRVQKFSTSGTFLLKWGSCCQAIPGEFRVPQAIDVDPQGNVFVSDGGNHRVEKFTNDGVYLTTWDIPDGGLSVTGGLGVDLQGNVYVGELNVGLIRKYSGDGTLLQTWTGWGPGCYRGAIGAPYGLTADASGMIYDADGCNVIQKFDGADGRSVGYWGSEGADTTQFDGLKDVAVAPNGTVYTIERSTNRVQMFGPGSVPALTTTWGRVKGHYR